MIYYDISGRLHWSTNHFGCLFPTQPNRHTRTTRHLLGQRFISGGHYNAKHTAWGSRLITPRRRVVYKTMERLHLRHLPSGEPTYWPFDNNKLPELVDFCVTKGIPITSATTVTWLDLSSDHSPVLVFLTTCSLPPVKPPHLSNR
jgi:hypothetical protein